MSDYLNDLADMLYTCLAIAALFGAALAIVWLRERVRRRRLEQRPRCNVCRSSYHATAQHVRSQPFDHDAINDAAEYRAIHGIADAEQA